MPQLKYMYGKVNAEIAAGGSAFETFRPTTKAEAELYPTFNYLLIQNVSSGVTLKVAFDGSSDVSKTLYLQSGVTYETPADYSDHFGFITVINTDAANAAAAGTIMVKMGVFE